MTYYTWEEKSITFGDRTIMFASYALLEAGRTALLEGLGFHEINAVVHMGDAKTNIDLRNGANNGTVTVCIPNWAEINPISDSTISVQRPIVGTNNGTGRIMIIGRRGSP